MAGIDVDDLAVGGTVAVTSTRGFEGTTLKVSVQAASPGSSQNNYDPGSNTVIALTPSAAIDLTGISGGSDGRVLYVRNLASNPSFTITLKHNSGSSSSGNRIGTPQATDCVLSIGEGVTLVYYNSFWMVFDRV